MTHAYYHAQSSARTFGGVSEDYLAIHKWFDLIWTVKWLPVSPSALPQDTEPRVTLTRFPREASRSAPVAVTATLRCGTDRTGSCR